MRSDKNRNSFSLRRFKEEHIETTRLEVLCRPLWLGHFHYSLNTGFEKLYI